MVCRSLDSGGVKRYNLRRVEALVRTDEEEWACLFGASVFPTRLPGVGVSWVLAFGISSFRRGIADSAPEPLHYRALTHTSVGRDLSWQ